MTIISQLRKRAKATHILSKRRRSSGATDGLVVSSAFRILAIEIRTCDLAISAPYHGVDLSVPCVTPLQPSLLFV